MFKHRATQPERIDTGDYTPEEYERFLHEIRFINRYLGDRRALERTLLADIARRDLKQFSVLDVGAGTGELLGVIAEYSRKSGRQAALAGLDLNDLSAREIAKESVRYPEIAPVRGDAFQLPFADGSLDYVISSLFFHHLSDNDLPTVLQEMKRVARLGIAVIDLERRRSAWLLYQIFCLAFRISPLVRQDGSLSIKKGFTLPEMTDLASSSGINSFKVLKVPMFRVVITSFANAAAPSA